MVFLFALLTLLELPHGPMARVEWEGGVPVHVFAKNWSATDASNAHNEADAHRQKKGVPPD
jgi:hypothetical protein